MKGVFDESAGHVASPGGRYLQYRVGLGGAGTRLRDVSIFYVPQNQRARVTARFYRAPGTSGDGCGLGLAIVDEIVRGHHALLDIGNGANDRGTRVRVTFPAA